MGSSASQTAPPADAASSGISNKLALGAGCYWGTEKYVKKDFQKRFPGSIKKATVGFMSPLDEPPMANPSYKQVCSGQSSHVEVLYIELNDPAKHFEELIRFFFQFHDPTTKNRQGNDAGSQYASWIFYGDEEQKAIAEKVRDELQELVDAKAVTSYLQSKVTTQITSLREFTKAQAAHQEYLANNPNGYCNHRIRFKEWPMLKKGGDSQQE